MAEPNRKVIAKNGRTLYYLDNKLASESDYEAWASQQETKTEGGCPFCGKTGTRTKFVHLQLVELCEDHYQDKTTGEIAEIIRSKEQAHA